MHGLIVPNSLESSIQRSKANMIGHTMQFQPLLEHLLPLAEKAHQEAVVQRMQVGGKRLQLPSKFCLVQYHLLSNQCRKSWTLGRISNSVWLS